MAKTVCEKILNFISDQRNTNQWDNHFIPTKLAERNLKIGQFLMLGGNRVIETLIHFLPTCMFTHVPLCDPMDCSPPGSSVHGIFLARILKWVAISSSREPSRPRDQTCVSSIGRWILYPWATWEAPYTPCMHAQSLRSCLTVCDPMDCSPLGSSVIEFARQECWSGLPCPPRGDLADPRMTCISYILHLGGRFFTTSATWKSLWDCKFAQDFG